MRFVTSGTEVLRLLCRAEKRWGMLLASHCEVVSHVRHN